MFFSKAKFWGKKNLDKVKKMIEKKPTAEFSSERKRVKNILLIGLSQHGKSSFANFLCTGAPLDENPVFSIGTGLNSCTHDWVSKEAKWKPSGNLEKDTIQTKELAKEADDTSIYENDDQYTFRIIDTPGFGSDDEVSEHMYTETVYKKLKEMKDARHELSMVLIVVKYPCLLDDKLKFNLGLYKSMFLHCMTHNVHLVVTHVEQNDMWRRKQRLGTQDASVTVAQMAASIAGFLGREHAQERLHTMTRTMTIDCKFLPDSEEELAAHKLRNEIFHLCKHAPGMPLDTLRLPKTMHMRNMDRVALAEYEARRQHSVDSIAKTEYTLRRLIETYDALETCITQDKAKYAEKDKKFKQLNTNELVCLAPVKQELKWYNYFGTYTAEVETERKIREVYEEPACGSVSYKQVDNHLYVTFKRDWISFGSVQLYLFPNTYMKDEHEEELMRLSEDLICLSGRIDAYEAELQRLDEDRKLYATELENLRREVKSASDFIKRLTDDFITLDDLAVGGKVDSTNNVKAISRKSEYQFDSKFTKRISFASPFMYSLDSDSFTSSVLF